MFFRKSRSMRISRKRAPLKRKFVRRVRKLIRKTYTKVNKVPFPPYFLTTLRYAEQGGTLAMSSGGTAAVEYIANSCYDPNSTGGGHQPRFYDSLCGSSNGSAPYHDYLVYGAKVYVTFNNYSTGIGCQVAVGYRNYSTTAPDDIQEALERSNYKIKDLAYYAGGPTVNSISMYIPINKVFGISARGLLDDTENYGAPYNNNPAEMVAIDVLSQCSASSTSTIGYHIKIIYKVKFFNRNDVADS